MQRRKPHKQGFSKKLTHFSMVIMASVFLCACMPLNDQNVNTELFESKEQMKTRTAELKKGMSKKDAFAALNIPMEKFDQLSTPDVQIALYGNSQLQGTPAQLESFKSKLMRYEGYALPYRSIESQGSFGFGKMKVKKTGHSLMLVLIFEHGKLLKASVQGQQNVNEKEDQYIWNSILKTGVKAAL